MDSPHTPAPRECDYCPAGNLNLEYHSPHTDRPREFPNDAVDGAQWKCRNRACRNYQRLEFIPN